MVRVSSCAHPELRDAIELVTRNRNRESPLQTFMNARSHHEERDGFSVLPKAPPASSFPEYPASWYLFCHTAELRKGPLSKRVLGHDLVVFRTASGRVALLNARCSHLGANLGCGRVVGESIQCPFHNWKYGADGRCTNVPGAGQIPSFARQDSYPVV